MLMVDSDCSFTHFHNELTNLTLTKKHIGNQLWQICSRIRYLTSYLHIDNQIVTMLACVCFFSSLNNGYLQEVAELINTLAVTQGIHICLQKLLLGQISLTSF